MLSQLCGVVPVLHGRVDIHHTGRAGREEAGLRSHGASGSTATLIMLQNLTQVLLQKLAQCLVPICNVNEYEMISVLVTVLGQGQPGLMR